MTESIEDVKALVEKELGAEVFVDVGGDARGDKPLSDDESVAGWGGAAHALVEGEGSGASPVEEQNSPAPSITSKLEEVTRRPRNRFNPVNWKRILDPNRETPPPVATLFYNSTEWTFLKRGEVVNLAGDAGVGKSKLMMDILRAMTSDDPMVGGVRFAPGKVMVVDEEGDDELLAENCSLFGLHLDQLTDKVLYLLNEGVRLDVPDLRDDLFDLVQKFRPDIIFFDARVRISSADENDSQAQARLYNEGIKPLAREFGVTTIILDHTNKPGMNGPRMTDHRIRGSSEKSAQVDRNWLLSQYVKEDTQTGQPTRDELIWNHGKTRRSQQPPPIVISRSHQLNGQLRHQLKQVIGG